MQMIQIEIPDESLLSLNETPAGFASEIRMLAAVKLFELGRLSSSRAAQIAGMSRVAFLLALGRYQVSPFQIIPEELEQDIENA